MKRISVIFTLSIMLFTQTQLSQLLKFPVFVQHYFEHKADDKNITLAGFVILHYFSGNTVDDDYARDMQLPFKTNDCIQMITSIVIPEHSVFFVQPFVSGVQSFPKAKNNWIVSNIITDIFRPPQFS